MAAPLDARVRDAHDAGIRAYDVKPTHGLLKVGMRPSDQHVALEIDHLRSELKSEPTHGVIPTERMLA